MFIHSRKVLLRESFSIYFFFLYYEQQNIRSPFKTVIVTRFRAVTHTVFGTSGLDIGNTTWSKRNYSTPTMTSSSVFAKSQLRSGDLMDWLRRTTNIRREVYKSLKTSCVLYKWTFYISMRKYDIFVLYKDQWFRVQRLNIYNCKRN